MDIYHIWASLKAGIKDTEFSDAVHSYLGHLKAEGGVAGYRVTRRKLGLGHPNLPEWHLTLEFESMAQMDGAFNAVSSRADPVESFHHAVNSKVEDVFFALYRIFPMTTGSAAKRSSEHDVDAGECGGRSDFHAEARSFSVPAMLRLRSPCCLIASRGLLRGSAAPRDSSLFQPCSAISSAR
ncbi:MAG: hypothetical protein P8Q36_15855 [Alphaproteobacteria bacterium]|nr:hypothetical protein [Alphaproteobacteria bacterium]